MAGDLEFSVRLSADGSAYVGPVRVARQETENLSQAVVNARAAQIQATDAVIQQSKANDELGASLHRTLDRYDPLGAKLRQLTADFDTLNKAMTAGVGTDANTAAVDAAYAKINTQIASTKALMVQAGAAGAEGFGKMEKGGIAAALATAGARRELIVLGHEAVSGNFSRIPGSFLVLAERMSATALLFNPITLGVGALAAAAAVLGVAFVHGAQEVQEMDRALAVTNDYAGQTRSSMRELAASMTETANVTIGTAKEIVTELVSSGRIGSEAINQVAAIAGRLAEATGTDIDKVAKELIKVFDNPLQGALNLDKQFHFLTVTEIEHLKVLTELADKTGAQTYLAGLLTDALPKQAENVGFLTTAWHTFTGALSKAWDIMQSIGRTNTSGEALTSAKKQLAYLEVSDAPPEAIAAQKAAVDAAQALATSERDVAKAKGEAAAAGDKQKTVWNEITKASKQYAIQAKETELAAVKAFSPETAEQARIQADAVKNLTDQIAKMKAGPVGKEAKNAVADYSSEIQKLNDEMNKVAGGDGGYSHLIAANEKYQKDLAAGKQINIAQVQTWMQTAVAADEAAKATKEWDDTMKAALSRAAAEQKQLEAFEAKQKAAAESTDKLVASLNEQTKTMFLSNDERERATALAKLQDEYDKGLIPTEEALANAVAKVGTAFDDRNAAAASKKFLREQEQAYKQTFEHIRDTITDNLTNAFLNGEKLGKALVNTLKQLFGDLVLRPIISAVVSPIAGTATSLLAGGAQAAGGGGNLLGTASNLSSLSNLGSIGTTLSSIGGAASAGYAGISATAIGASEAALYGGVGSGAAIGAGGVAAGLTEGLTAGLAAIGPVGWVGIAGLIAYGIFKGLDKGPASRTATFSSGPASLVPDASRDAAFQGSSAFGTFGISKDKWLSPDDKGAGEAFGKTLTAITTIDNKIADLVGTDQTKLITDALNAHSITVGLGKEHTDINASGGPGAILQDRYTTVVSAIDAGLGQLVAHFQGAGEELANFVVNLVSLHEAVAGGSTILEDAQKQWDAMQGVQASSTEKLRLMGDSVRDLSAQFDGSVASAQALASATLQYKQAATEAIVAIHGLQKSLTDMFQATREHVEFAGLDKQSTYDLYKSKGSTLLETISQTNDPEVVNQLSQKINGYFVSAFDLLDPSEQLAHKQEFLDDLNNVDKQTHDRLDTIGGNISDNATDVFKGVNDALTKAGQQFLDAATKQGDAADKIGAHVDRFGGYVDDIVNAPPLGLALEDNRSAVGNTG